MLVVWCLTGYDLDPEKGTLDFFFRRAKNKDTLAFPAKSLVMDCGFVNSIAVSFEDQAAGFMAPC